MAEKKRTTKKRAQKSETGELSIRLREQEKKQSSSVTGAGETSVTVGERQIAAEKER